MSEQLSHLNRDGDAQMVDVADKPVSQREARATATVFLGVAAWDALLAGNNKKGDVLGVARIAGIQAAKRCGDLIPLCHPLPLSAVNVDFVLDDARRCVQVLALCRVAARTGVEMEALTAVSIAALTIYDMCKAVDKSIKVTDIALLEKSGGKSGHWRRDTAALQISAGDSRHGD
ncbi:MAG: cyclic pyranopterin monophosphate synthase MoaC [Pseudomonadales bacterium]